MKSSIPCRAGNLSAEPTYCINRSVELSLSMHGLEILCKIVLDKGMCCRFRVSGFSMSPFIRDGDVVTVAPLGGSTLGLGDVAFFAPASTQRLLIHRVVGKSADSYMLKGDNLPDSDGMVPQANILGHVQGAERGGKKVIFGFGPEKVLIAFLTRRRYLTPLLLPFKQAVRLVNRRLKL